MAGTLVLLVVVVTEVALQAGHSKAIHHKAEPSIVSR